MRYPLLFALGIALALATPAVAQTVTKPTETEQQRRQQTERHIQPLEDDDDDALEMPIDVNVDSLTEAIEARVDSLREALEARADSIREAVELRTDSLREAIETRIDSLREALERRADSLQGVADLIQEAHDARQIESDMRQAEADARQAEEDARRHNDSEEIGNDSHRIDADSLRAVIRQQMATSREMLDNARKINKQMCNQMRDVRKIRVLTRVDTTGMAKELQAAERALESARRSVQPLDSSMILFGGDPERAAAMVFSDSAGGSTRQFVVVTRNDSTLPPRSVYLSNGGGNSLIVRSYGGANGNATYRQLISAEGHARVLPPMPPLPPLPPIPAMTLPSDGRVVVFGDDSIRVIDGSDVQTIIQVSGDPASSSRHTVVVISSRTKGEGMQTITRITMTKSTLCRSAAIPEAIEKPAAPVREDGAGHTLEANYPNPFSGSTTIAFTLPRAEHATLSIYDAHGTLVRTLKDEEMSAGSHSVMFDASGLPSGTYLYRLVAGGFNETKTMTLEK